jgi:hypothetical protein
MPTLPLPASLCRVFFIGKMTYSVVYELEDDKKDEYMAKTAAEVKQRPRTRRRA